MAVGNAVTAVQMRTENGSGYFGKVITCLGRKRPQLTVRMGPGRL